MAGHGGAWKVAYADFVTAMMALFMVLWISAQDKKILIATSRYFQNPFSSPLSDHSGIMPFNKESNENQATKSNEDTTGKNAPANQDKQITMQFLNAVAADFYRLLHLDQNLDEKPVDVQVTSDGLRLTLFDRSQRPLFAADSAEFTDFGRNLIQNLAWVIERHHFNVTIDGHTKAGFVSRQPDYSPWELSADRANAARRALVFYAVEPEQIERVTGYADTRPLPNSPPDSDANQRVTLSLTLTAKPGERKRAAPAPAPASASAAAPAPATAALAPPVPAGSP